MLIPNLFLLYFGGTKAPLSLLLISPTQTNVSICLIESLDKCWKLFFGQEEQDFIKKQKVYINVQD